MSNLRDIGEVEAIRVWEGVTGRRIEGERVTLAVVELDPNAHVPEHRHPNEQVGIVLTGGGRFRIGDEQRDVRPGSTWRIVGNEPHEMWVGPEGAVVLDIFSPPRRDWDALPAAEAREPRWP